MKIFLDGQIWFLEALAGSLAIEDLQAWWVASTARTLRSFLGPVLIRNIKKRCPSTAHHNVVRTMLRAAYHREQCACVIVTRSDLPRDVIRQAPQPWLSIPETAVNRVLIVFQKNLVKKDEDLEEDEEEEGVGEVGEDPIVHAPNTAKFHEMPLVHLFFKTPIGTRKWTAERIDETTMSRSARLTSPPWAIPTNSQEDASGSSQPAELSAVASKKSPDAGAMMSASDSKSVPSRVVLQRASAPAGNKRLAQFLCCEIEDSSAAEPRGSFGEADVFDGAVMRINSQLPKELQRATSSERMRLRMLPWQES
jgi:hypothetical protein